ncbi:MAG: hypothetical protein WDO13_15385 [Verrucomicrobiota bacterium]
MKRSLLLSLLAFALVSGLSTARAADPQVTTFFQHLQAGKKQTVVAYGTSLTAYGAWVQFTQQWFDTQFPGLVTVINSGGPGRNSDWGLASLKTQVLDQPDLVFIEFSITTASIASPSRPSTPRTTWTRS